MANQNQIPNISIENARLIFKNFSGQEGRFNKTAAKSVCVVISTEQMARELLDEGWNVRMLPPREEGDEPLYYLQVAISYDYLPPNVYMVTRHNKTLLNDETITQLDYVDILNVDLVIRPYHWNVNGNSGIKAYLKTMYVVVEEDEFADKYRDVGNQYPNGDDLPFH